LASSDQVGGYNGWIPYISLQVAMSIEQLAETARAMVAPGKGIIAIDESSGTCKKRFDSVGIECTEETRRAYREMLLTAPGANKYLSGAILFDETIRQSTKDGVPFAKYMMDNGMIPGIKVDMGTQPLAGFEGEVVTEGLDGLRARLAEYYRRRDSVRNLHRGQLPRAGALRRALPGSRIGADGRAGSADGWRP
jgi:hypothetical protein